MSGRYLETMTWPDAERELRAAQLIIIPVGARSKEHGHHLPLNTDWLLAEYFTSRVLEQVAAVALPAVAYGYSPAFVEYPGSIHIERATFAATISDICRSLARHSSARMYVLNTGVSTNWALEPARLELAQENIVMDYTDLLAVLKDVEANIAEQPAGTHADEMETSMMLVIRPEVVNLERARRDIDPRGKRPGPLTRDPDAEYGVYSPTGAWGDPTLATREKGQVVIETLIERIVQDLTDMARPSFIATPQRQQYLDASSP